MLLTGHIQQYDEGIDSLNVPPSDEEQLILKSSDYICVECGFASRPHKKASGGFMQVINIGNQSISLCMMCACSVTVGRQVAGRNDYGKLIYAPDLSQTNINNISRITIAVGLLSANNIPKNIRQNAKTLYDNLLSEQYLLDGDVFPFFEGSYGNLDDLASICRNASPKVKKVYATHFKDIRFLPAIEAFKEPVRFWLMANPSFFEPLLKYSKEA